MDRKAKIQHFHLGSKYMDFNIQKKKVSKHLPALRRLDFFSLDFGNSKSHFPV